MGEAVDLRSAARNHDWAECERAMFVLLSACPLEGQRDAAEVMLRRRRSEVVSRAIASHDSHERYLTAFKTWPVPEEDAAYAELENAEIEYQDGNRAGSDAEATKHYATSIRSSVLAKQIGKWIDRHPDEHLKWIRGEVFEGPTFLEDSQASEAAEREWQVVGELLQDGRRRLSEIPNATVRLFEEWRDQLL